MRWLFVKPPDFPKVFAYSSDTSLIPPERAARPRAGLAEAAE